MDRINVTLTPMDGMMLANANKIMTQSLASVLHDKYGNMDFRIATSCSHKEFTKDGNNILNNIVPYLYFLILVTDLNYNTIGNIEMLFANHTGLFTEHINLVKILLDEYDKSILKDRVDNPDWIDSENLLFVNEINSMEEIAKVLAVTLNGLKSLS